MKIDLLIKKLQNIRKKEKNEDVRIYLRYSNYERVPAKHIEFLESHDAGDKKPKLKLYEIKF